ncbi:MAG TPA: amidase [Casimicrobiaceae bacterium]|nr:amidase [Casimicrobiaceae bacterium]
MTDDLTALPLATLAAKLTAGETTSRALVEACLARIDAHDAKLHAFVDVYRSEALACADAADLQRRAGMPRSPLHGVPIALKDLLHIEGRATTAGSKSWSGRISDHTATVVEKLLAAGMIVLGKTHMVEFAFGGWGRNAPMGAPWNPWDMARHRVAGGSSSGSAVAVAAALAPAAIGSDTGGSVRIPAALCGITGHKPTYGLISLHGAVPLSPTLDSIGPLTRTVDDAALLTGAMAGGDAHDAATLAAPRFDARAVVAGAPDIRGTRIVAMASTQFPAYLESAVAAARDATIATLRELGAVVEERAVPFDFDALARANGTLIAAEAYAFHRAYIEDAALPVDPWVRSRLIAGKTISAADYVDALAARRRAMAAFAEWMRGCDALLTPTLPITATPLEEVDEATTPLALFTRPVNYLGACGVSLPAGASPTGLPIGMQLIGAAFADATVLRIGRAFQHATDWHLRRPAL